MEKSVLHTGQTQYLLHFFSSKVYLMNLEKRFLEIGFPFIPLHEKSGGHDISAPSYFSGGTGACKVENSRLPPSITISAPVV